MLLVANSGVSQKLVPPSVYIEPIYKSPEIRGRFDKLADLMIAQIQSLWNDFETKEDFNAD
jgi:hypothetical protein